MKRKQRETEREIVVGSYGELQTSRTPHRVRRTDPGIWENNADVEKRARDRQQARWSECAEQGDGSGTPAKIGREEEIVVDALIEALEERDEEALFDAGGALADCLERMDDHALVKAVRELEERHETQGREYLPLPDAIWTLQKRMGGTEHRERAVELLQQRRRKDEPVVVPREHDLGWNVQASFTGRVLRALPGPERAERTRHLEVIAEDIVRNRLARHALEWLEGYEAGGAARERAARRQDDREGGTQGSPAPERVDLQERGTHPEETAGESNRKEAGACGSS